MPRTTDLTAESSNPVFGEYVDVRPASFVDPEGAD